MQPAPHTRARKVTIGELAEAFIDAAEEVCEDPIEAGVAGAVALWEFVAGKCAIRGLTSGRQKAPRQAHRKARRQTLDRGVR